MIAPDRVVMRDRPTAPHHGVWRRALDCEPFCAELARLAERVHREIGRRAVGIRMCELAGDLSLAAGRLKDRALSVAALIASWNFSKRSHVIEVSNVSLITPRRISRSIA